MFQKPLSMIGGLIPGGDEAEFKMQKISSILFESFLRTRERVEWLKLSSPNFLRTFKAVSLILILEVRYNATA